jgi:hypothetical protein
MLEICLSQMRLHLADQMLDAVENYKAYSGYYFAQSTEIHE